MESKKDNYVKVNIHGQEYTVKAQADSDYIKNVARYVNEKMDEVERSLPNKQASIRVAILAAMNITDELFSNNLEKNKLKKNIQTKTNLLIKEIDKELGSN
jgi:cell division protein ZapA